MRFHLHRKALDLEEIPDALNALWNLDCVELRKVLHLLALRDAALRRKILAQKGPFSAEQVVEVMTGWRPAWGLPRPPTESKRAQAFVESISRELERTSEPALLAELERRRARMVRLVRRLKRLKRPSHLDRTGLFLNLSGSVRMFDYTGGDSRRQGQKGLVSGWPRSHRRLIDYFSPNASVSTGMTIGPKDRHTGTRPIKPFLAAPIFGGMHFSTWTCFSPNGPELGYSVGGPAGIPLNGFAQDPVLGKLVTFALPLNFQLVVGERYASATYFFKGGPLGGDHKLPGTSAGIVMGLAVGIHHDAINHVTGPLISAIAGANQWVKKKLRPASHQAAGL